MLTTCMEVLLKQIGGNASNPIVNKEKWSHFRNEMTNTICRSINLTSDEKKLLKNKLDYFNNKGMGESIKDKLKLIEKKYTVHFSKIEYNVLKGRHEFTHEGTIKNPSDAIKSNKLIMMMINKIIISTTYASTQYTDYYTEHSGNFFKYLELSESIE